MTKPAFRFERALLAKGLGPVAGVDEAGRGPLAGPVAAAAVILDIKNIPKGLNDSKLLRPEVREALFDEIVHRAHAVSVAMVSAADIDRLDIRQATLVAMRRAVAGLAVSPAYVLVDGNDLPPHLPCPGETIVKGDVKCLSIAAASIIAKVTRDRLMRALCSAYPAYGFSRHAGYGTKAHFEAIATHGPCPFHRLSFSPFKRP
ncbi:MAG: ribonuclease HII [Beijerinckiaceae bacterium]|jgi:ribonuclease HII